MSVDSEQARELCYQQFQQASNMTDEIAALSCLANSEGPQRVVAISQFYEKWQHDVLVVDKWLRIQAMSRLPNTLENVQDLTQHEAFTIKNPNKVRSLIGAFCAGNQNRFHAADGAGYRFLADYVIKLDKLNPQLAARMSNTFSQWRRYDVARQDLMKKEMERVQQQEYLSNDVFEVINKSLTL